MQKLLLIATAAAVLAACGEAQRSTDNETGPSPDARTQESGTPEAANETPDRQIARSVETEPGDWHYKKSNGYPWAGFGPPASEAIFTISCRRGQLVFGHVIDLSGAEAEMKLEADGDTATVELTDLEGELPMAEGTVPANSVFIDTLLNTERAFNVRVEDRSFALRPAPEYRQVIRECRAG